MRDQLDPLRTAVIGCYIMTVGRLFADSVQLSRAV